MTSMELTRRAFLGRTGLGFGAIALDSLIGAPRPSDDPLRPRPPMFAPKARSVIYLHMAGAPSQLDLFDYKPKLVELDGQRCPDEFLAGKRFAFIKGVPNLLGTMFSFARHGESGAELSELLPHLANVVDKIAIVKSMFTDQFNHSPAQLLLHTGDPRFGSAAMGSWVTYGLGTMNRNLPGYVVLVTGGKAPSAGKSLWGSGFLPSIFQGTQCRTTGDPVLFLSDPPGLERRGRREALDALRDLNEIGHAHTGDPETLTRIAQYELAFRMQAAVPDVMDISNEPQHVLDLYGAVPGYHSNADTAADPRKTYKKTDASFANNCLLARRLVERGVRFVQLFDWGWDHHGSSPGESIDETLPIKCAQTDRAVSALIVDLEQRGLLDETLVIWGGEFGRTPMMQNNVRKKRVKGFIGRDHHPFGFTMWLAGGGIKGGQTIGATDELGYYITENKIEVRDLQATILHLLGLDPYRLSYPVQGLDKRLIGPTSTPRVVTELLA